MTVCYRCRKKLKDETVIVTRKGNAHFGKIHKDGSWTCE